MIRGERSSCYLPKKGSSRRPWKHFFVRIRAEGCILRSFQLNLYDALSIAYDALSVAYDAPSVAYDAPSVAYDAHSIAYDALSIAYDAHSIAYDALSIAYDALSIAYDALSVSYVPVLRNFQTIGSEDEAWQGVTRARGDGLPLARFVGR